MDVPKDRAYGYLRNEEAERYKAKEGCITGDKRIHTPSSFTRNLFRKQLHECDEDGVVDSSVVTHMTLGTGQGKGLRFHLVEGRQRPKLSVSSLQISQATLTIKDHSPEMLLTEQLVPDGRTDCSHEAFQVSDG